MYSTHADIFRWCSAGRVPAVPPNLVLQLERQRIWHRQNQLQEKKRQRSGGGKRELHLQSKQGSGNDQNRTAAAGEGWMRDLKI